MALKLDLNPVARVVDSLLGGTLAGWVLQAAVLLAGVFLAWLIARRACRRINVASEWQFGKGDFERVAFPLLALVFVGLGNLVLERYGHDTAFLDIATPLILAFAFTRLASYILGHVIHEGPFQQSVINVVRWVAWILAVLHIAGVLPELLAALEGVGFTFGKNKIQVSLRDIARGVVALFFTVVLAMWISRVSEGRVMASKSLEVTTRVVITKVVRISTVFIAIFIALPMVGIDVTTLSVFSGALGVGLGFGLQKIASNYVSGFIVLLDRSLRIGDVVTVDGRRGEVRGIENRYTVIKGGDGVESIIPNEKLITESVNHHTYSDPKISMVMSVWISYESDVDKACDRLVELARRHKRVIEDPPAAARVKQLGENGIELELTVWIADPAAGEGDLKSMLFKEILKAFKADGIEIPYPRRDVRLIATAEMEKLPTSSSS